MNIAAITITYNDDFKLDQWSVFYKEYKKELHTHIIVDNGSDQSYVNRVKSQFKDSVILQRETNGGLTVAYNQGIRYALAIPTIDAIMLIGNDIRLPSGELTKLYDSLFTNSELGMIAPAIIRKDSSDIESVGCFIDRKMYLKEYHVGQNINDMDNRIFYCTTVAGGMNLSTRQFYEQVGLQDETLFMYSDEVDMGLRAQRHGYKIAVSTACRAWHQHINPSNKTIRKPYTAFLISRNKVYLARKHFGFSRSLYVFVYQSFKATKDFASSIKNKSMFSYALYFAYGNLCGLLGIKKNFKFIINN
ncbi:glycosyltransferase family 2 protein [Alistipes indistinctus]|jgi:GT2 family glycosyltransferase|uniref:glycosyltransferase family 2 protein n=1 Tax=Alistipes indistinctus TaxID=626932 RepID=UPI000E4E0EFD|nr:glycosyltransferase [Alistipes indistinctus]RGU35692.1 glycosyltransferase family 2 protein [Alistipes indistinctus]